MTPERFILTPMTSRRRFFPNTYSTRNRAVRHGTVTPYNRLINWTQNYLRKFRDTIRRLIRQSNQAIPARIAADENVLYLAMVVENIISLPANDYDALHQYLTEEVPILRERRRRFFALLRRQY